MSRTIGEKWSKLALLACLILALIGSSAVSVCEAFCDEYLNYDSLNSSTYFSSRGHTVDWLAEVTLRKEKGNSNSQLRNRLLRMFTLSGTIAVSIYLVGANLKIYNNNIPVIRNLVLLKLRI